MQFSSFREKASTIDYYDTPILLILIKTLRSFGDLVEGFQLRQIPRRFVNLEGMPHSSFPQDTEKDTVVSYIPTNSEMLSGDPNKPSLLQLPYETSIATISLPKAPLLDRLKAMKSAGFTSFELMEIDLPEIESDLERFKQELIDLGLKISIFQPFRDFEGDWEGLDKRVEEFEKRLHILEVLGVDLILVCCSCQPLHDINEDRFVEQLRIASELADKRGIRIAFEALSWGTHWKDLSQAWSVVKRVERDNFGICLDSFHIFMRNCELDIIRDMKGKIFFVQISDSEFGLDLPNFMYQSRSYRTLPYQGSFENLKLLRLIHQTGYEGPISLECFSDAFRFFEDLDYSATESYNALVGLMYEMMKSEEKGLTAEINSNCNVLGFRSADKVIEYTDPKKKPVVDLIVDNEIALKTRLKTLGFQDNYCFTIDKNIEQCSSEYVPEISINCSRLTFNSLSLYLRMVLQFQENVSKRRLTGYGLPKVKTFYKGEATVTLMSEGDDKPVLREVL